MMMAYTLIISLDVILMVLISVAFLTLLERKILSYIQIRKGPNKVGFMGLLQHFSDAIKLFTKENFLILKSNYYYYFFSPLLSMLLMLLLWNNMPFMFDIMNMDMSVLMFLCLLSMGVYGVMIAGSASNSIYSIIGSLRSIAQAISYEVSMIIIMFNIFILMESYNFMELYTFQVNLYNMVMHYIIMVMLYISFLAELNRTPFDLAEGESELVSGFNTEYMSGSFALIFIAEYGMIMLMMLVFSVLFFGSNLHSLSFFLIYMIMLFMSIWIRGTFPRFRYDKLMTLTWKCFLPVSLFFFFFFAGGCES